MQLHEQNFPRLLYWAGQQRLTCGIALIQPGIYKYLASLHVTHNIQKFFHVYTKLETITFNTKVDHQYPLNVN